MDYDKPMRATAPTKNPLFSRPRGQPNRSVRAWIARRCLIVVASALPATACIGTPESVPAPEDLSALAAAYAPPGKIKAALRHPMLAGVKAWALAHLLVNGDLGSLVLFGAFLAWAVFDRIAVKRRGDAGAPPVPGPTRGDAIALGVGTLAYIAMYWLHPLVIGVPVI